MNSGVSSAKPTVIVSFLSLSKTQHTPKHCICARDLDDCVVDAKKQVAVLAVDLLASCVAREKLLKVIVGHETFMFGLAA